MEVDAGLYAIESKAVREIVPTRSITRLPGAPPHVRGIMNLRGSLIIVVDVAQRLLGTPTRNPEGSTIVVQMGERLLGLGVDDVRDVQFLDVTGPEGVPYQQHGPGLIRGLGRLGEEVVIVVDVGEIVRQTLV
jgi:purine-binding chemotaxis protein CheW